jgi:hypothetical protein
VCYCQSWVFPFRFLCFHPSELLILSLLSTAAPPTAPGTATPAPLPGAAGNATGTPAPAGNSTGAIPNALRAAGAGTLATLIGSPAGQSYASELQQGPHTVFAPVDSALAQLPLNSTSPADLTALLNYHTVPGTVDVARLPPTGHAIVRTALRGAPHVNLREWHRFFFEQVVLEKLTRSLLVFSCK